MSKTITLSPDADTENADWTKQTWDFPPYKSREFMQQVPDLDAFRKSPAYAVAVEQGLIHDDEWVADWVNIKPAPAPTPSKKRTVHVHIHKKD